MTCSRLLNRNYTESSLAANRYVSSEDASFPVSNLYDKYRRRKVWRSAGFYEIASGSNTIVFRESAGVDLTATITPGEYESFTLFAAAVKAALEAAGVATYTVSKESDKRIKILSDLSGGATVFELRWASSTAMAAIIGFDAVNLSGAAFYVADDIAIHTEEWIKWDMGVGLNPDSFILASQRNEYLKFSPSAVIRLQGNDTDNWSSPAYDQVVTFEDSTLLLHQDGGLHTAPLRYWRVKIVDKRNPNGYVEAGLVFLGTSVDLARGCIRFPFRAEPIDPTLVFYSESGQRFADKRPQSEKIDIEWNVVTSADREALRSVFASVGLHTPFWIIADPTAAFASSNSVWTRYVSFLSVPRDALITPNNWDVFMSFREEI